jgi:hypothetical protein
MNNDTSIAQNIDYISALLAQFLEPDSKLISTIPEGVLRQAKETSIANISVYLRNNEDTASMFTACAQSFLLGYLIRTNNLKISGLHRIELRLSIARQFGLNHINEGGALDFCMSSCVMDGAEAAGTTLLKKTVPNIYLDIDGVLLTKDRRPAPHVKEFLSYVLKNFPDSTYWLTTHCKGDTTDTMRNIGHLFDSETLILLRNVKPTKWEIAKTEGINLSKSFLWFDDNIFSGERQTLTDHGLLDNWIEVNLSKNTDQLRDFVESFPIPVNTL